MNVREKSNDSNNNSNEFICGVVEGFYGRPWSYDQRKDLFKTLRELRLNSFMYAPKDDTKHRAKWRQLYSEVESKQLKTLIEEARANQIDFYYSLAPGLDMIYSDEEELDLLRKKYNQLVSLGCESFAILFDDIEPSIINDKDRMAFKNYASAQVFVTNMVFNHLKRPKFLFCPTEYCESRAVPSVTNSIYLSTIGQGLATGVDIMWSGSRVVSRLITEESIETLTRVIRRPPVIWENLHANDYDKKRVFLGPYSGRSTRIIPKLRGVLTNPNCEYEANYIAIHTLAQWSRCSSDSNQHNQCNTGLVINETNQAIPTTTTTKTTYDPIIALNLAIKDWLPHVLQDRNSLSYRVASRNDQVAAEQLDTNKQPEILDENNVDMVVPDEITQSSTASAGTNKSDMDTQQIAEENSCDSSEMMATEQSSHQDDSNKPISGANQQPPSSCFDCAMGSTDNSCYNNINCTSSENKTSGSDQQNNRLAAGQLNHEGLSLLVDLFYLPFEHGNSGYTLLNDIRWLKDNRDILSSETKSDEQVVMIAGGSNNTCHNNIWLTRAQKVNHLCSCIQGLVDSLMYNCPNKVLITELYPYLADMRVVTSMVTEYIRYLRDCDSSRGQFFFTGNQYDLKNKELVMQNSDPMCADEQEPWIHRGGLIGDVQRLLS